MVDRWGCALALALVLAVAGGSYAADLETAEVQHYELSMDKITRYMEAAADLKALEKTSPRLAKLADDEHESLDQATQRISTIPEVPPTLAKHGLTPREFLLIAFSSVQTAMAVSAKPKGESLDAYAAKVKANPRNMALYEQHRREIMELASKYKINDE